MAKEEKQRRIRRIAPCPSYDVEKFESWLQDMALEGWHLEKDSDIFGLLSFVKAAPQAVRYRLEPKKQGTGFGDVPDSEVQELCAEYGWEYVDSSGDFFIYRSIRSDAREMNTDLQVQAAALKAGKRSSTPSMILELILWLSLDFGFWEAPSWYMVSFGLGYLLSHLAALIWCSLDIIFRWLHLHRLHKQLKANIPLDHNKPWKQSASFHLLSKVIYVLVIFILFGVMFGSCTRSMDLDYTDTADYPGAPPFVTSADILEGSEFTAQSFLRGYNAYTVDSNFFAPKNIEWKEYGKITTAEGITYSGSLIITYYELHSTRLAEGLMDDLYEMAQDNRHFTIRPAPELNVDEAVCYMNIYPCILIRQGNIVIEAFVGLEKGGQYLLEEWSHRMAEMLIRE